MNILLLGDGGWGTALAILLAEKGHQVVLWGAFPEYVAQMRQMRENTRFLPGVQLPPTVELVADMGPAMAAADLLVFSTPVVYLRRVAECARQFYRPGLPVMSVAKGIENDTLLCGSSIIRECLGTPPVLRGTGGGHSAAGPLLDVAVLSGPSHAEEVARHLPATVVAAAREPDFARFIQQTFMSPWFRVYTSDDPLGVELAGALKNVIAIAAGISDGLGLGDNAKAALLTRGLAEITRLGVALGSRPETFAGLAGIGDLITTCISPYGRNLAVGRAIAQGRKLEEILAELRGMVPEGVWTARAVVELARRHNVEMPISEQVYRVLFENKSPRQAVADLMSRGPRPERDEELAVE